MLIILKLYRLKKFSARINIAKAKTSKGIKKFQNKIQIIKKSTLQ